MNFAEINKYLSGTLVLCLAAASSAEQPPAALFREDAPIKAVLTAPISQAYAQKRQETSIYMPGVWSYMDQNDAITRLDVQIRPRGISRRRNCSHPPLWLNFKKSQVKDTLFSGQDKLKLVGPCKAAARYQQLLLLEYLTYRAFQLLTPYSLDTRLIRLSYNDSDKKDKTWTHVTFVIEEHDAAAKRLGTKDLKRPFFAAHDVDPSAAALVELFQYMIGNTDFSMLRGPEGSNCCHNMKPVSSGTEGDKVIPIPYDFDSSGLVDAPYAYPALSVPGDSVRKRFFMGRCKPEHYWQDAIKIFQAQQQAIIQLFVDSEELTERYRKRNVKYLEEFFELIADPKRVEKSIFKRCRGAKIVTQG